MITLWDTTGNEAVKALSAERRNAGGVASGLALTLIAVVEEKQVREAEVAAATAAAAHPCRLLIVVRDASQTAALASASRDGYDNDEGPSRLDAEVVVGGRLGPAEAVVMRMKGRLALHAESVVIPLLAPDVPVVTWWHDEPPAHIANDPLGVIAERRITDADASADPVAALRRRAQDYAAGDTDLAWTRTTPWRTLLSSALDTATSPVTSVRLVAQPTDPTAALLRGWLTARLRVPVEAVEGGRLVQSVTLRLASGDEIEVYRKEGLAMMRRTGFPDRSVPLPRRSLGDQLAEELRRLGADQPYADALSAATGVSGLSARPAARVHEWVEPSGVAA